jgi:hypothetical protein
MTHPIPASTMEEIEKECERIGAINHGGLMSLQDDDSVSFAEEFRMTFRCAGRFGYSLGRRDERSELLAEIVEWLRSDELKNVYRRDIALQIERKFK